MRLVHKLPLLVALLLAVVGSSFVAQAHEDKHQHKEHHGHRCIHDEIKDRPGRGVNAIKVNVKYEHDTASTDPEVRRKFASKASTYAPFRVTVFWHFGDCSVNGSTSCGHCTAVGNVVPDFQGSMVTCSAEDVLTDAKKNYLMNTLMPNASSFYLQALSVVPVSGNLILGTESNTCGEPGTPIPSAHQTTGIPNTDIAVYVTAVPGKSKGTVAWAAACRTDAAGRPIAAHVNFAPGALTNAVTQGLYALDNDKKTAIHEVAHALGFTAPWFGSKGYLALDGVTYVQGGTTVATSSTLGKSVTYISSPRVVREIRDYFGCSTAVGGEIEDQGGSGTAGSHWEKRVLFQDVMTGISDTETTFHSRITLAFLEDTGFYVANYAAADSRMTFGKGKGCNFVTNKCNTLNSVTAASNQEYCFDTAAGTAGVYCSFDRLAKGYCPVTTYSSVPSNMQYFSNAALGSEMMHADYCPVIKPNANQYCIDPANQPTSGSSNDIYGETYGSTSRCFDSTLLQSGYTSTATGNTIRCFPVRCVSGVLTLTVKGTTVKCPADGSAGNADLSGLSGFTGTISCPAAADFGCTATSQGTLNTPSPATASPITPTPNGATPSPPSPSGSTPSPNGATPAPTITIGRSSAAALSWAAAALTVTAALFIF